MESDGFEGDGALQAVMDGVGGTLDGFASLVVAHAKCNALRPSHAPRKDILDLWAISVFFINTIDLAHGVSHPLLIKLLEHNLIGALGSTFCVVGDIEPDGHQDLLNDVFFPTLRQLLNCSPGYTWVTGALKGGLLRAILIHGQYLLSIVIPNAMVYQSVLAQVAAQLDVGLQETQLVHDLKLQMVLGIHEAASERGKNVHFRSESHEPLSKRDRLFLHALVHHDYLAKRKVIRAEQMVLVNTSAPGLPAVRSSYNTPYQEGRASVQMCALAGGSGDAGLLEAAWHGSKSRAQRSCGKLEVHIVTVAEGSGSRARLIPLRAANSATYHSLRLLWGRIPSGMTAQEVEHSFPEVWSEVAETH
ncbi:hypothetical protein FB451DRAFT_1163688 [Mycena latifolia]|nr:hypothetical protein FB451DRAFT_1163688 [Mycena latifolia]